MAYIEQIVDIQTGKVLQKPYSKEQITEVEKAQAAIANEIKEAAAEAEAKEAARATLLDKLGITADEAKLLLG